MKRKGLETIQLVLLAAICIVGALFILNLMIHAFGEGCKMAQMDELNKIWGELRYWESRKGVVSPVSFNTIPDFMVESCVKGITYEKTKYEDGEIIVEWTDGSNDKMPARGEWNLCKPLPPGEEPYHVRVSFRRVDVIGFCVPCKCKQDNSDCNETECVGSVICGDLGVCWDGEFYSKNCFWDKDCLVRLEGAETRAGYCMAYCVNTTGSDAFSECSCVNYKKCEAACKPEEIPDTIPEDGDAWTEDSAYKESWFASSLEYATIDVNYDEDSKVNSYSVHLKTAATPSFSIIKALGGKHVYLPDFDKLHFWFYSPVDVSYLYVYFDTGESWQTAGLACELGEFKSGWSEYTVILKPELNPNCEWTSEIRSIKYLLFSSSSTEIKIDGLYLCKNC